MLRSFTVANFKSFAEATLPLAPLTVLVGANASGKSNGIEAMRLLSWLAEGRRLGDLLSAIRDHELSLRGGLRDLAREGISIRLGCELEEAKSQPGLDFSITIDVSDRGPRIVEEHLVSSGSSVPLYKVTQPAGDFGSDLQISYNNFARGGRKPQISGIDQQAVFTQLATPARFAAEHKRSQRDIPAAADRLRQTLSSVLYLDPDPRRMRDYSFLSEKKLSGDGATISSIVHHLCEDPRHKSLLLEFIRDLPEQDISGISFINTTRGEVMVRLHETFGGEARPREAALLSDGTLRVLAVAGALLSVAEGSTVVIEEIDNGVHPSRAEMLMRKILETARQRRLRVLLTTHNPALLDAMPPEIVPDTLACYRDPEHGDSRVIRLEDVPRYPELVAQGPVGRLMTKGVLDRFLKDRLSEEDKVERDLAWLSEFRARHSA